MFFTEEDYKKIELYLINCGVKDSCLEGVVLPFQGNEKITIVQDGKNRTLYFRELIEALKHSKAALSDLYNVTDHAKEKYINLKLAIELVPYKARKIGLIITFLNPASKWELYQFTGASILLWNELSLWNDLFNLDEYIVKSILPDEEDLTKSEPNENGNSYLSLKDREYNPDEFSGLGKVILRKNIMEVETEELGKVKKNVLLQDMINKPNTIYEIRYDFDLNNQEIAIPEGCVLDFLGGSLSNGILIGNNTKTSNFKPSLNCILQGTFIEKNFIYILAHNFKDHTFYVNNIILHFFNSFIIFEKNIYYINGNYNNTKKGLVFENNNYYQFNGSTFQLINLNDSKSVIFYISKDNINLSNFNIIGDYDKHTISSEDSSDEWNYGVLIESANNINITNSNISKCYGDNINIITSGKNIFIKQCNFSSGRRCNISIEGGENIHIQECTFIKDNKNLSYPKCFIDIEPIPGYGLSVDKVFIKNNVFNCQVLLNVGILVYGEQHEISNINIENNKIFGCVPINGYINISGSSVEYPLSNINIVYNDLEETDSSYENNEDLGEIIGVTNANVKLINNNIKGIITNNRVIPKGLYTTSTSNVEVYNCNFNNCTILASYYNVGIKNIIKMYNCNLNTIYDSCITGNKDNEIHLFNCHILSNKNIITGNTFKVFMTDCSINAKDTCFLYDTPDYNIYTSVEKFNFLELHNCNITGKKVFSGKFISTLIEDSLLYGYSNIHLNNCNLINSSFIINNSLCYTLEDTTVFSFTGDTNLEIIFNNSTLISKLSLIYGNINSSIIFKDCCLFGTPNKTPMYNEFTNVFKFYNTSFNGVKFISELDELSFEKLSNLIFLKSSGFYVYHKEKNIPIWFNHKKNKWIDSLGNNIEYTKTGTTEQRPYDPQLGFIYKDTDIKKWIIWNGTAWEDLNGLNLAFKLTGAFNQKPTLPPIGFAYFCTDKQTTEGTTNGIMIYHKGNNIWVDALGRVVS